MRIEELTSDGALNRLRPEWAALWQRAPGADPFQHPDWLLPWWENVGGGELFVLAVRDGADLVAVAPFYIYADESGDRQLTLLGNGVSDCCGLLLARPQADIVASLAEALRINHAGWTRADLRDLPANSILPRIMSDMPSASVEADTPTVVLALEGWPAPSETRPASKKMMADIRRRRRHAEEVGPVKFEFASEEMIDRGMDRLFALHRSRWRAQGQSGVLSGANLEAFYREIASRFGRLGWLRLSALSIGDRVAGCCLGFQLRRRAYHYITGFDPELSDFAIGGLMLHEIIGQAASGGAYEFDFLRGEEDYKRRWGGIARPQYRVRAGCAQTKEAQRAKVG